MNKFSKLYICFVVTVLLIPGNVFAKTIAQFESEVNKYTAELAEKQRRKAKNDAEVAQVEKNIKSIETQIITTENEIKSLEREIEESNQKIAEKNEESKKIIQYYQIENGDNIYLEYVFGSQSITDMVYRLSVTEQLTEYNDRIMQELRKLINDNKKNKVALAEKRNELKSLKKNLENEKERIEADTKGIVESMPSIETRIKEAKANLSYYKNLGCGINEDITACQFRVMQGTGSSLPSVGTFQRPIEYGTYSRGWTGNYAHRGVDMSSSNKSIAIHPIAEGEVAAIYQDNCSNSWCISAGGYCQGNAKIIVIRHNYNGGYIYSMYVHLSRYGNYSVGSKVTKASIIGYMGTTGCSTGPHLHLEITRCHWKAQGGCTYKEFEKQSINPVSLGLHFPYSWSNF